jgi:hypothetical protein
MSQKLTLAIYLQSRGEVKSLTRIEAEAFGIPYPLLSGWPARFGAVEITGKMLETLISRIAGANQSTANRARRGLDAVMGSGLLASVGETELKNPQGMINETMRPRIKLMFPGFTLRMSLRHRTRHCGVHNARSPVR